MVTLITLPNKMLMATLKLMQMTLKGMLIVTLKATLMAMLMVMLTASTEALLPIRLFLLVSTSKAKPGRFPSTFWSKRVLASFSSG